MKIIEDTEKYMITFYIIIKLFEDFWRRDQRSGRGEDVLKEGFVSGIECGVV